MLTLYNDPNETVGCFRGNCVNLNHDNDDQNDDDDDDVDELLSKFERIKNTMMIIMMINIMTV